MSHQDLLPTLPLSGRLGYCCLNELFWRCRRHPIPPSGQGKFFYFPGPRFNVDSIHLNSRPADMPILSGILNCLDSYKLWRDVDVSFTDYFFDHSYDLGGSPSVVKRDNSYMHAVIQRCVFWLGKIHNLSPVIICTWFCFLIFLAGEPFFYPEPFAKFATLIPFFIIQSQSLCLRPASNFFC